METVSCLEPIYREKNLSWRMRTFFANKHQLKREQCDEEEAESNHEEQIESCPETLWDEDPQSQAAPKEAERNSVYSLGS